MLDLSTTFRSTCAPEVFFRERIEAVIGPVDSSAVASATTTNETPSTHPTTLLTSCTALSRLCRGKPRPERCGNVATVDFSTKNHARRLYRACSEFDAKNPAIYIEMPPTPRMVCQARPVLPAPPSRYRTPKQPDLLRTSILHIVSTEGETMTMRWKPCPMGMIAGGWSRNALPPAGVRASAPTTSSTPSSRSTRSTRTCPTRRIPTTGRRSRARRASASCSSAPW